MEWSIPIRPAESVRTHVANLKPTLHGDLDRPPRARGLVIFSHGGGSERCRPHDQRATAAFRTCGLATFLVDLLSRPEEVADASTGHHLRFDIELLASRLDVVTESLAASDQTSDLRLAYLGWSTGAAAALCAATRTPHEIFAIASIAGRPDLASGALPDVRAPTLFIIGSDDTTLTSLNREAAARLNCAVEVKVVSGAIRMLDEPDAFDAAVNLAASWFTRHLPDDLPNS